MLLEEVGGEFFETWAKEEKKDDFVFEVCGIGLQEVEGGREKSKKHKP